MQKLNRATLLELEWRDFLFWPLVRPAGFLYDYVRLPMARVLAAPFSLALPGRFRRGSLSEIISKEILTLANLLTLYGVFLWGQLLYLVWAQTAGYAPIALYGIIGTLWSPREPSVWIAALLTLEILLTDLIDGPAARVNNDVTALGTILDHTRDYLTAFTVLFFLVALTASAGDMFFFILEAALIGAFSLVMTYHWKLRRLFLKKERRAGPPNGFTAQLLLLRRFALEEYQTPLTGRIQFGTLAAVLGFGLFHYAMKKPVFTHLFAVSLVISLMATSYYLYELWGEHYEKWQENMHEKSQHFKEKLLVEVERRMKEKRK
jgi:phosphatidylglycerophosphate synthase